MGRIAKNACLCINFVARPLNSGQLLSAETIDSPVARISGSSFQETTSLYVSLMHPVMLPFCSKSVTYLTSAVPKPQQYLQQELE